MGHGGFPQAHTGVSVGRVETPGLHSLLKEEGVSARTLGQGALEDRMMPSPAPALLHSTNSLGQKGAFVMQN